ncbi:MAG: formylglycine-generating enzyme family protein [Candidatus Poribacteria bacterium]|nr:formylglycine-generating enzyme family protein [Candidatus Poribacteria bacterium]
MRSAHHTSGVTYYVLPKWLLIGVILVSAMYPSQTRIQAEEASSEMVLIPAGTFQMGSDRGRPDETPVHQVWVDAFYLDRYEVTNADYQTFILANPQWQKSTVKVRDYLKHWEGNDFSPDMDQSPVTYVTYGAAQVYCEWRSKRLPTEAEWEKAARGGKRDILYPWGNQVDSKAANYDARGIRSGGVKNMRRYLKPVGAFPANGYMLYDMGGNVSEWCVDRYVPHYQRHDVTPQMPAAKGPFVVRGGSWFDSIFDIRCVARAYALSGAYYHIGFRCAKDAEKS